jgi:membrane protease subunit HflK
MAWNEPGGDKDPWSGGGDNQGPPDLDQVVKKMQERLGSLFGGRKSSGNGSGNGGNGSQPIGTGGGSWGAGAIVLLLLAAFLLYQSFYIIGAPERGVVLRFGAFKEVTGPGFHFLVPLVDRVIPVNVDQVLTFSHTAEMLTQDENIVDISLSVQYKVQDPSNYRFQDWNPDQTIKDATETALREVVGKNKLDVIITQNRSAIAESVKLGIQELIDSYRIGLQVVSVNIQDANPPDQVKAAFDDANKAREDKVRIENQAQAYANDVVPKARGAAARRLEDAKAYKEKVVAEATGEASRFLAVLAQYNKAPEVTRKRLYLDTVEQVLGSTNKVIVDVNGGNSLMYLPLDQMIKQQKQMRVPAAASDTTSSSAPAPTQEAAPTRDTVRGVGDR